MDEWVGGWVAGWVDEITKEQLNAVKTIKAVQEVWWSTRTLIEITQLI